MPQLDAPNPNVLSRPRVLRVRTSHAVRTDSLNRLLKCLAAIALFFAACDDGSTARIHGRLLRADGSPAAGYRLFLSGDFVFDPDASFASTDVEGRYEFVVQMRADAPADSRLTVTASDLDSVVRGEMTLPAKTGDTALPDVTEWDSGLAVTAVSGGDARATWKPAPEGFQTNYQLIVYQNDLGRYGPISWISDVLGTTTYDLPPEVTEDRFANLVVRIGSLSDCGKDVCVQLHSMEVMKPTGTLVPLSRGAACMIANPDGSDVPLLGMAGAPCPLTDGSTEIYSFSRCGSQGCTPSSAAHLVVDLAAPTSIQTIVFHTLALDPLSTEADVIIEVSTDGRVFTPVKRFEASSMGTFAIVHLDGPTTARQVRIVPAHGGILALTELSIF